MMTKRKQAWYACLFGGVLLGLVVEPMLEPALFQMQFSGAIPIALRASLGAFAGLAFYSALKKWKPFQRESAEIGHEVSGESSRQAGIAAGGQNWSWLKIVAIIIAIWGGVLMLDYIQRHDNYSDCILEHMRDAKSDIAARAILKACREKYPSGANDSNYRPDVAATESKSRLDEILRGAE